MLEQTSSTEFRSEENYSSFLISVKCGLLLLHWPRTAIMHQAVYTEAKIKLNSEEK